MNCQEKISMTCVLVAVFGCAYSFAQGCGACNDEELQQL